MIVVRNVSSKKTPTALASLAFAKFVFLILILLKPYTIVCLDASEIPSHLTFFRNITSVSITAMFEEYPFS